MKDVRLRACALCLALGLLAACSPAEPPVSPADLPDSPAAAQPAVESTSPQAAELVVGKPFEVTIPAPSLEDNLIGEPVEQPIAIYLPDDYETSGKSYPVIYFLPGFGNNYLMCCRSFQYHMMTLDEGHPARELIVVGVNGTNRLGGSFYTNSPVTGNWQDFVTRDVVEYLDSNYRTIPDAAGRGLAGHSMGGYGAVAIAMETRGIFGSVYSMSPGLFGKTGLERSLVDHRVVGRKLEEYREMNPDAAHTAYLEYADRLSWSINFAFAYASAFAYAPDAPPPYVEVPARDTDGNFLKDEVWARYEAGFGNLEERVAQAEDNLRSLRAFGLEYGTRDEFVWIPEGTEYFSQLLHQRNIPHHLSTYAGNHEGEFLERIGEQVLPFFVEAFHQ